MPAPPAPLTPSDIVTRLRAAGCVFAEDEASLLIAAAGTHVELEAMVDQRVTGLPLEHVIGWTDFCGVRIAVDPGVFVPRHRTEFLARRAAALARPGDVVLDLCCGSGAVGAALAATVQRIEVHAVDIDPVAVRCAHRNLDATGAQVYAGDLYEPLPPSLQGRVAVLVANVPYVPTEEIDDLPREARLYEARVALDGGGDGLDVLRRVAAAAPRWLASGGHLCVETSKAQSLQAEAIFAGVGLTPEVATCDELEATIVIGTMLARDATLRE